MKFTDTMVLFYGTSDCFSNWHRSYFTCVIEGADVAFNTSEQYMMYQKAKLFGDYDTLAKIMATKDPREQKRLGREVKDYNDARWKAVARDLMVPGLLAKFEQNPLMGQVLMSTGDRIIVEASPTDKLWGVGLTENDPLILDPANWQGTNWLGEVLMRTRGIMRAEAST